MYPITFTASTAWAEVMKPFDAAIRREVYDAVFEYAATKQVPKMSATAAMAFAFIKMDMDAENERLERRREVHSANCKKRWSKKKGTADKPAEE